MTRRKTAPDVVYLTFGEIGQFEVFCREVNDAHRFVSKWPDDIIVEYRRVRTVRRRKQINKKGSKA